MSERQYIDFKLYLTKPDDEQIACQVALLPTPEVGESMHPVDIPAAEAPSQELRDALAGKEIRPNGLRELGKSLGNCLLPEGVIRRLFRQALSKAGRVRLRLIIADNDLRQWPWEYAYLDPVAGSKGSGYLVLDPRISMVRHEALSVPHPQVSEAEDDITNLRMLVAASQPKGTKPLRLEKEVDNIKEALDAFELEGVRITCDPILMDATYDELEKGLQRTESIYVFHFAGHGIIEQRRDPYSRGERVEKGYLLLMEDKETREVRRMDADVLAALLLAAEVRLAVLGACLTGSRSEAYPWDGVAGALVARGIPAIIAMQYEVEDEPAVKFSDAFYTALASGVSLDEAMSAGRLAMVGLVDLEDSTKSPAEWGVPVLYSRLIDGRIFPERMKRAGPAAEQFRHTFEQNIELVEQGGEVVGVIIERGGDTVNVELDLGNVVGEATGAIIEADPDERGGRTHVTMTAKRVSGRMVGGILKKDE